MVWRNPGDTPLNVPTPYGQLDHATDRLTVGEVRADAERVYFDVTHRTAAAAEVHDSAAPELYVRVDHCEGPGLRPSGTVWRDWPSPATVSVPIRDLPDGELDFSLRAFATDFSLSLRKRGKTLEPLRLQDRAGYVSTPEDPDTGLRAGHGLVTVAATRCVGRRMP